jgi:phosphonate transport system substrate-binding protein
MVKLPFHWHKAFWGVIILTIFSLVLGLSNPAIAAECKNRGDLAVEDPSVYENVFKELMDHIAKKTGKQVKWYGPESYAAQVEAMRSGRLHISGFAAGATVYGVNLAGFHPTAMMGNKDGTFRGYQLWLITPKDSDIKTVKDLKGRKVAHVTPSSNGYGCCTGRGLQGYLLGQARQLHYGGRERRL